jgi:hypothetical protein
VTQEKFHSAQKRNDQAYILKRKRLNISTQKITLKNTEVKVDKKLPRWIDDVWDNWHPDF